MVARRLLRVLLVLAVLLMPLRMLGGGAMASPHEPSAAMAAGHCAGMPQNDKKAPPAPCCDCMLGCAAIHSSGPGLEHLARAPLSVPAVARVLSIHGLHPKAAIPPPRAV